MSQNLLVPTTRVMSMLVFRFLDEGVGEKAARGGS